MVEDTHITGGLAQMTMFLSIMMHTSLIHREAVNNTLT